MTRRTLSLKRETLTALTALTDEQLAAVVGAGENDDWTIPNFQCLTIQGPRCIT